MALRRVHDHQLNNEKHTHTAVYLQSQQDAQVPGRDIFNGVNHVHCVFCFHPIFLLSDVSVCLGCPVLLFWKLLLQVILTLSHIGENGSIPGLLSLLLTLTWIQTHTNRYTNKHTQLPLCVSIMGLIDRKFTWKLPSISPVSVWQFFTVGSVGG